MRPTLFVRRAELVAPVRCCTWTVLTSSVPSAKVSSVGGTIRGLYRSRPMTTTVTTMTKASSSSSPPSSSSSSSSPQPPRLRFRRGTAEDAPTLFKLVLNEKMLPFGLRPERFIIAEEEEEEGRRRRLVAFGQLVQLDGGGGGGSGSGPLLFELRSLVTVPESRGKGIGAEIVRRLVDEAAAARKRAEEKGEKEEEEEEREASVVLTTISRRVPFYQRLGFSVLSPPPKELSLEIAIGSVVARVAVGDSIVAMGRSSKN